MLNYQMPLDRAFQALADPTRRAIVERLSRSPASVSELKRPLAMSLPAVMQHLAVLETSGLVLTEKAGRVRTCRINPAALAEAERWIAGRRIEWERRLDRLSEYLDDLKKAKERAMTKIDPIRPEVKPAPVRVARVFSAPRETVFRVWSSADHVKRWFCPAGYSVPAAKVEMRVGGAFEVCMRSPEGVDHWTRGTFTEVVAPERLAIDLHVVDPCGGGPLFTAFTEVTFSDHASGGTLMEIKQSYSLAGGAQAEQMIKGAPEGWRQTLDNLEAEIARMGGGVRSVVHGAFHLERTYDATADDVYRALSDEAAKSRWFFGPPGWRLIERAMDFRVGGRERLKGGVEGGATTTFDAVYHDIIPRERIVYTYEMRLDDRKISVSLATLQIKPAGERSTKVLVDEQGAFLDGYDDAGSRERGTGELLDKLGASLRR